MQGKEKIEEIKNDADEIKETLKITEIDTKGRHRKHLGDIKPLKGSIEDVGLLHPIVITETNKLICGFRRLQALMDMGLTELQKNTHYRVMELENIVSGECAENDERFRKNFTPTEKVAIIDELLVIEKRLARERRRAGLPAESFSGGLAKDKASNPLGWSRITYEHAKEVVDNGDENLIDKMDKTGKVFGAWMKLPKQVKAKEIREGEKKNGKGKETELFEIECPECGCAIHFDIVDGELKLA